MDAAGPSPKHDIDPVERVSESVMRVLAPNPGPMTLDGTNSYLLGAGASRVVVDPGPLDDAHLARLSAHPVDLVLITHHHADHTEAAVEFARRTSAPVRAVDAALCIGADPLVDGEELEAAGVRIRVLTTPGHTADSVCFALPHEGPHGAVITGDTVLGRGTTVIVHPDGSLAAYLASLRRLRDVGPATALVAHGPVLPDLAAACEKYLAHRAERLTQVQDALTRLGLDARLDESTVTAVADAVYAEAPVAVRFAAEASVRAQLAYLAE